MKHDIRNNEGMRLKPLANKQVMVTQPLWLEIPWIRNKVHIGKNNSLVSSDSTKIDFKINYVHSYGVCESARDCSIERLNFVIKILWGVTILTWTKF